MAQRGNSASWGHDYSKLSSDSSSNSSLTNHFNQGMNRNMELMQKQDEGLDQLGMSVDRIGLLSREIGNEIEEQNRMLGDMQDEVDDASGERDDWRKRFSKRHQNETYVICLFLF